MKKNKIDEAREFALSYHGNQKYGHLPYISHLDEVAAITKHYGCDAQIISYLHDVIEDTEASESDVRKKFGDLVAICVGLLSDEPGETRKIRKAATYHKMSGVKEIHNLALLVKAADRLANMQACVRVRDLKFLKLYIMENKTFKPAAYRDGLCDDIWLKISKIENSYHNSLVEKTPNDNHLK